MATAELVIAFDARADKLEVSLKRVTTQLNQLQTQVAQTGARVQSELGMMGKAFDSVSTNLTRLAVSWAGFRGAEAIIKATVASNELSQSFVRLSILTGVTSSQAIDQFTRLSQIAAGAGQPVEALTNQFARFYTATASIGASRTQVEAFVKTLGDFSRLSAQGPQEAAAAITQLAQGLASGRLQGDELKSILENMPVLATMLAQELGVSVGELRKMGEEGKLTAENVFPAILRAGQRISEQLQGLPLSLRQAWTTFADASIAAINRVDSALGASEWLSKALSGLTSNVQTAIRQSYGTAITAPLDIRAQNLAEQLAAVRGPVREIEATIAQLEAQASRPSLRPGMGADRNRALTEARAQREQEIIRAATREDQLNRELVDVRERVAQRDQNQAAERATAGRAQTVAQAELDARAMRESAFPLEKAMRERAERLERLREQLAVREAAMNDRGTTVTRANTDEFKRRQEAAIEADFRRAQQAATSGARADAAAAARAEEAANRRDDDLRMRQARERRSALEVIRGADRGTTRDIDNVLERLTSPAVGSTVGSPIQVALQQGIQLQEIFGALETQVTATGTAIQRSGGNASDALGAAAMNAGLLRDALAAEPGQDATILEQEMKASIARMETALTRVGNKAKDTWNAIGVQGVQTFSQELAGGIIDFVTTGEQKFDELAANFLKNIAKMILQVQILNALKAGLGPNGLNLLTFANGGATPADRPYIVGERGPELFVPTGSGYVVPSHKLAQGGGSTIVNVFNQASGTTTRQQERSNGLGGKEVDIYIEQIVQRGLTNGRFDAAMGQSFGASRSGRV